jgi:hypothetical protein
MESIYNFTLWLLVITFSPGMAEDCGLDAELRPILEIDRGQIDCSKDASKQTVIIVKFYFSFIVII